jgi:LysM repeat protein
LARLFEFNDLKPQQIAADDQLVFIQRKRKTGEHEYHIVQPGENTYNIAQTEAIRLESLLEYNNLGANMQPAVGETLNLRSKSPSTPKLAPKNSPAGNFNSSPQTVAMNNSKPGQKQTDRDSYIIHAVQLKETLYSIARKYNVSPEALANWNQLQGYEVKIGQSLKIYK